MADLVIERDVLIEAPAEVVWRTITEPDQMSQWFADRVELVVEPGAHGYMGFGDQGGPVVVETVDPAGPLLLPLEPSPRGGAGDGQLDAGRVHADAGRQRADPSSRVRKRPRAAAPGPTRRSSVMPTSTGAAGPSTWTASPAYSRSANRDDQRRPMTSCGRPSPTRLVAGSSTSWSATVTSAPAGWPATCPSPARRSPSTWSCSKRPGWSAGASRAGRFSTR